MWETIKNYAVKIQVGSIVATLLFIIYTTISLTSVKNSNDFQHKHIYEMLSWNTSRIENLEERSVKNEKEFIKKIAEISITLTNIENALLKIEKKIENTH